MSKNSEGPTIRSIPHTILEAIRIGNLDVVNRAIEDGAVDVNAWNGEYSMLHLAAMTRNVSMMNLLIRHGATVEANNDAITPLRILLDDLDVSYQENFSDEQTTEAILRLLSEDILNTELDDLQDLLGYAAMRITNISLNVIKRLADLGVDLRAVLHTGETLFETAVVDNRQDIAEFIKNDTNTPDMRVSDFIEQAYVMPGDDDYVDPAEETAAAAPPVTVAPGSYAMATSGNEDDGMSCTGQEDEFYDT